MDANLLKTKSNRLAGLFVLFALFNCDHIDTSQMNESETKIDHPMENSAFRPLGAGYNVTREYANTSSVGFQVIDVGKFSAEQTVRLVEENPLTQTAVEAYGENAESYLKSVASNVAVTSGFPLFGHTLSIAFSSSKSSMNSFDAKYIYGSYSLIIKQKRYRFNAKLETLQEYLTREFLEDLRTKTPEQIVADYGTHVLLDIYSGARMDTIFQSETKNDNRANAARIGIKMGVKDVFDVDVSNSVETKEAHQNYNRTLVVKTRGGDPSRSLIRSLNLEQATSKIEIADWQNSSNSSNAVLVDIDKNGLARLDDLIADPIKKAQLKSYIYKNLNDNQVHLDYVPLAINRYYNSDSGDHYYTQSKLTPPGYQYEGIAWRAYSYKAPDTVPIHRYYNHYTGDHYYTVGDVVPAEYQDEGVEFYAYATQTSDNIAAYQYFNQSNGDHFYALSSEPIQDYQLEGVAFYVLR